MQDLLLQQIWAIDNQVDPFAIFNANVGYAVEDEYAPFGDHSVFLSIDTNSNSSFDSLESAVSSPVDGFVVHDNLFGENEELFFDDSALTPQREEAESPVATTVHHFGHYQQTLESAFDSQDEIQADSEDEVATPTRQRLTKRLPTMGSKGPRNTKVQKSTEAKVKKPRATGAPRKQKRVAVAAPTDAEHVHDGNVQPSCCLSGCGNTVTNRLRFSLRRNYTFKNEFLDRNWNKICQYHYFSDLYQHKKSANMH